MYRFTALCDCSFAVLTLSEPYFEQTSYTIYLEQICKLGLDEWLVKVSWLGELASVFWWVELDLFSLECNEVSSSEF